MDGRKRKRSYSPESEPKFAKANSIKKICTLLAVEAEEEAGGKWKEKQEEHKSPTLGR